MIKRALALVLAIGSLSACDEPFIEACYSCLDADPSKPVPADQLGKIALLPTGAGVPEGATNVFFAESCGIDCQQIARFDLPSETALERVAKVSGKAAQRFETDDLSNIELEASWAAQSWFDTPQSGAVQRLYSHIDQDGPWPLTIVLMENGASTRVYWFAGTM